MKAFIELFIKALIRGVIYGLVFALVGGGIGMVLKKGFIQGAYIAVLAGSALAMLVAVYGFIGSPKTRFSFFTHNQYDLSKADKTESKADKTESKASRDENSSNTDFDSKGFYPAIIAIEMLVIGFIIEAMLH